MPAEEVFVDASAFVAVINKIDVWHERALQLHNELNRRKSPLVTSDWVLSEFLASASRPKGRIVAAGMIAALFSSSRTTIIEATRTGWNEAFQMFSSYQDKSWSLVDCSSMLICRDRGISRVFTSDRHSIQFGLEILMDAQSP